MNSITVLDQNTINKIAAGEVIERPSAVVKELLENAIDAGANAITAEIKEGGIRFIRITDNGSGIPKSDISVAFLRHSTSKIKSIEDLLTVSSLGFRGEALSSIAAVSQLELVTKTSGKLTGVRYMIEGGTEKAFEDVGCPDGTTFIVRNLFFNTPARRKFLKSPVTEAGYISDLIERLAVSHPNISFKYIVNNQIKLHTSGNSNLKDIIYNVYGRDLAANLIETKGKSDHMLMSGYIGKPIISRGNRNYMNYYINGRYIKSGIISKAIEEAYKPYTMTHRYPFTALHFIIEQDTIDVNVHPTKMDIRFKNSEEIYTLVFHTIKEALGGKELIPNVVLVPEKEEVEKISHIPEPFEKNRIRAMDEVTRFQGHKVSRDDRIPETVKDTEIGKFKTVITHPEQAFEQKKSSDPRELSPYGTEISDYDRIGEDDNYRVSKPYDMEKTSDTGNTSNIGNTLNGPTSKAMDSSYSRDSNTSNTAHISDTLHNNIIKGEQINLFEDKLLSEEAMKNHRIIGQLFSTYWIVEYKDKMFIVDQHAAHEKVLYERIMNSLKEKEYLSQIINPPIILTLSMREEETLNQHMSSLNQLGFEIEAFGGKEYAVRAVPNDMFGLAQKDILIELIDNLVEEVHSEKLDILLEKIASMSCKAAVKGNNHLSYEEAQNLIAELLTLENPYHCPHGRPTIISMSKYEIEKKFKRIL